MTYLDEVLRIFVDDISSKLNTDLSWVLQQSSEKLKTVSRQYSGELTTALQTQLNRHNLNLPKKLSEMQIISDTMNTALDYLDYTNYVIEFAKGNIPVNEMAQYETAKNLIQIATQRYLQNNEKLVIPLQEFEKIKAFWEYQAELGNIDAKAVLEELIVGQVSKHRKSIDGTWIETIIVTFSDDEKSRENLLKLAAHFLIAESKVNPNGHVVIHEAIKQTNSSLQQAIVYMVGRCIIEIRQAWSDQSVDFSTRLQNVIHDTKREFKEVFEQSFKNLSKSVINYLVGLITGFYKKIHQSIQKGGEHFKILCNEIWAFITGKNQSLFQTIINISKAISALAVITFVIGLHQYLASIGIPEIFVIIITTFVSALVTVAIFRLVEKAAQFTSSVFYTRDIAKTRCQEVERICEEVLPIIEEKVAQLDILIEQEDLERETLFNQSFVQIKASLTSIEIDQIVLAYQELYQYLGKSLPFKNEKEFDDFIMDGTDFIL